MRSEIETACVLSGGSLSLVISPTAGITLAETGVNGGLALPLTPLPEGSPRC